MIVDRHQRENYWNWNVEDMLPKFNLSDPLCYISQTKCLNKF